MSEIQTLPLVIVTIYMLAMLGVGFYVSRVKIKDHVDYMVAGRTMGLVMVAASLSANNIGGGSTMGVAQRAYTSWGLSAAWYVLAAAIAMIPVAWFAPRIRRTFALTISEVVGRRFGTVSLSFTAVLNVVALFCLTASQVMASGAVVSALTGLPLNVCVVIAAFVVIVYTTVGGMLADQISDLLQFVIIFLGMAIAVPFVISGSGGWQAVSEKLPEVKFDFFAVGGLTIISLILNYIITFLSGPEMVSRFSSAKDERTAQKAALLSAVLMALVAFLPVIIGLVGYADNPKLDNGQGTSALVATTAAYAPPLITGFLAAAIVAATMSSADSNLLCASTIVMNDIVRKFFKPDLEERRIIFFTRLSNVLICVVATGVAMIGISLIPLNLFAFAIRSAGPFAAYALGLAMPKATRHAGQWSIVVGTVAVVWWQVAGSPFGLLPIVFGAALGLVTFLLITAVESARGVAPAPSPYPSADEVAALTAGSAR